MSNNCKSKDDKQVHEIKDSDRSLTCGFCGASFSTTEKLYAHQRKEHDPDGIMFSDLGLPK